MLRWSSGSHGRHVDTRRRSAALASRLTDGLLVALRWTGGKRWRHADRGYGCFELALRPGNNIRGNVHALDGGRRSGGGGAERGIALRVREAVENQGTAIAGLLRLHQVEEC